MTDLRARAAEAAGILRDVDAAATAYVPAPEDGGRTTPDLPDVNESDVPAGDDVPVHVAWVRVMRDVQWLGKSRKTTDGARFNYRGIDDVVDVVGPALRKHGVAVIPVGAAPEHSVIPTKSGSPMNYCRTVSRFMVIGPRGDSFIGETPGEGFDSGDKSSSKAQSVALRTFYTQALAIPVNRPELDPEYGPQHEIAGPPAPTPAEYATEILDERTTMDRLSQIKQELYGSRSIGAAEVELADGEKIRLVDLVRRVGLKRKAEES
jgi:hypothetical protein